MSLYVKPRRLLTAAMIVAVAAGAGTAVLASGAGPEPRMITLKDGPERLLTIKGSDGADELTIAGAAPGSITIIGNREITNQRTDCDVNPGSTLGFCGDDSVRTIDMGMGPGRDELGFSETFGEDPPGLNAILQRGGTGADRISGSVLSDTQEGGEGGDRLRGNEGADDLDGGPNHDNCEGGPGNDTVRHCE
jgi:Ca2+-binding RTX toxin-like protein